jgi:hypothetical protein
VSITEPPACAGQYGNADEGSTADEVAEDRACRRRGFIGGMALIRMSTARTGVAEVEVMHGFRRAAHSVMYIVCALGCFSEEPIEAAFGRVITFHAKELIASRLKAYASGGVIPESTHFSGGLHQGDRYVVIGLPVPRRCLPVWVRSSGEQVVARHRS